jgi:hypothetical protein
MVSDHKCHLCWSFEPSCWLLLHPQELHEGWRSSYEVRTETTHPLRNIRQAWDQMVSISVPKHHWVIFSVKLCTNHLQSAHRKVLIGEINEFAVSVPSFGAVGNTSHTSKKPGKCGWRQWKYSRSPWSSWNAQCVTLIWKIWWASEHQMSDLVDRFLIEIRCGWCIRGWWSHLRNWGSFVI